MQPKRKDFRPLGGACCDYRPPLLTNGPRYFAGNSDARLAGPLTKNQTASSGSRTEVSQPNTFAVGVTAHAVDARGRQMQVGTTRTVQDARDLTSGNAEAEKYTALFSRMLQENILLSATGGSKPQPTSAVSLTRQLMTSVPTGQLLTGSINLKHPGPIAQNRKPLLGLCPITTTTTRLPAKVQASSAPIDLLGWTPSSQGLITKDLPPPPGPILSATILTTSIGSHAAFAPTGYLHAPAAMPLAVPPVSQYHPLPAGNVLPPLGQRWSTPAGSVPAPDLSSPASVGACLGLTPVVDTSKENPNGFLTKNLAGLPPTDILSRVNRMLAQNLFEMTTQNSGDNDTTTRSCSRDSRSSHSLSRGRSEDRRGRKRRMRSSHEEQHQGRSRSRSRRSRRNKRRSSRRSRSSYSSSSSAQSTPSSSSSVLSSCSKSPPQYSSGRNYRKRRDSERSSEKRKPEFCRICEIKIKGSFLAHRRGKAHIRKESSVQGGCDVCGIRCFNTYSEYQTHLSTEEHLQKRSKRQSQVDAENRKRLGLPENKVVIIRNPDGKEQEEELSKLDRLRKMALDRNRKSVQQEQKQEQEQDRPKRIEESSSATSKGERNSTERNAGRTNEPEDKSSGTVVKSVAATSPLRGCHDHDNNDVIIDLTGKAEEDGRKREEEEEEKKEKEEEEKKKNLAANVASEKKHFAAEDNTTQVANHTQVTSTTVDKAAKDDCLGREWVLPVTGFFCKICLKFFSAKLGEADVTAHCTSERHRDNYKDQMQKSRLTQPSTCSSSAFSSYSSTLSSPPNAGKCAIVYDENKLVKEIIIWKTTNDQHS